MWKLKSEFSFDACHQLQEHVGKCAYKHGHRWRCVVTLKGDKLQKSGSSEGMLIDFKDVKKALKILENLFDHKELVKGSHKTQMVDIDGKLYLPFRTTAENLAQYIYKLLVDMFITYNNVIIESVELYETPNNCIIYTEEE